MGKFLSAGTLDDLMAEAFPLVMREGIEISPSRGPAKELFGMLLELKDPRARVSRSQSRERIFSALGELIWYLSGSDDPTHIGYYIQYYLKPEVSIDGRVTGAYGPRLMDFDGTNQLQDAIEILRVKPDSRNAAIQIFDHTDTENAPCTLALQFVVRGGGVSMMASMRSNDLFMGLPHDIFAFTMIQEIVARSLGYDLGFYYHSVGSLHLYSENIGAVNEYLAEGWHGAVSMPAMPLGDPWLDIQRIVSLEEEIRLCPRLDFTQLALPEHAYWRDLALLLCAFKLQRERRFEDLAEVSTELDSAYFRAIVQERIDRRD